jgi:hypothetical protein
MATTLKRKATKAASKKGSKKVVSKSASKKASKQAPARPPKLAAKAGAVPASGPLTLEEARILAAAKRPQMAAKKAAPPAATPGTVGLERKKLKQERKAVIARRIQEYRDTMSLMKKRGARRPARKPGEPTEGGPVMAAPSFSPLQIFAEGDSWFDYPPFLFKGGVVSRLERRLGVPILNLAKAGDEVRYMLGVEERTLLAEHLTNGCPAGGQWDVLLFSGGGNDIVDNPMALWVKDWNPASTPAQHLNQPRFTSAMDLVRAGYEDLITLRDALSPTTHLVFHGYDFAIPDGRGVCFNALGPWLEPTFKLRGFPNRTAMFAVVKAMLKQFAAMLATLATAPNVTFINAQGTLPEGQTDWWHNELHPSQAGFDRHVDKFEQTVKALFPNRVV